jgi:hypothetical protein
VAMQLGGFDHSVGRVIKDPYYALVAGIGRRVYWKGPGGDTAMKGQPSPRSAFD